MSKHWRQNGVWWTLENLIPKLGAVGAGRVLWGPRGLKGRKYVLILVHKTNNEAKALDFFESLSLLKHQRALEAKIISDSRIIIVAMNFGKELKNPMLNFFLWKPQSLIPFLRRIELLHVPHSLNWIVDHQPKEAVNLDLE